MTVKISEQKKRFLIGYSFYFQEKKRYLIGYFERQDSPEYENFRRAAANLKDDCEFYAGFGDVSGF